MNCTEANDVNVFARAMLDDDLQGQFEKPWLLQEADGTIDQFDSEAQACAAQRKRRAERSLDEMTGLPVSTEREAALPHGAIATQGEAIVHCIAVEGEGVGLVEWRTDPNHPDFATIERDLASEGDTVTRWPMKVAQGMEPEAITAQADAQMWERTYGGQTSYVKRSATTASSSTSD